MCVRSMIWTFMHTTWFFYADFCGDFEDGLHIYDVVHLRKTGWGLFRRLPVLKTRNSRYLLAYNLPNLLIGQTLYSTAHKKSIPFAKSVLAPMIAGLHSMQKGVVSSCQKPYPFNGRSSIRLEKSKIKSLCLPSVKHTDAAFIKILCIFSNRSLPYSFSGWVIHLPPYCQVPSRNTMYKMIWNGLLYLATLMIEKVPTIERRRGAVSVWWNLLGSLGQVSFLP